MRIVINVNGLELAQQIKDVLESNIPEDSKTGLHHLLGDIYDSVNDPSVSSHLRFPVFEISKKQLQEHYKRSYMEFKAINDMEYYDMETLAALIGYKINDTMGSFDNLLKETFKINFATPFRDEAREAASAIDHMLDDGPLNGDDIEKLVEQFKLELQDRHGDLG